MVRALVLAAGEGARLRPLTAERPKALVEFGGLSLFAHQLRAFSQIGIDDVSVVAGHHGHLFDDLPVKLFRNDHFKESNMVESLMYAREYFSGTEDLLVSYGDLVFETRLVHQMFQCEGDLVVCADRNWRSLWDARMDDPASDAEEFQLDGSGRITKLGGKPESISAVQGQFVGLVRFPAATQKAFLSFFDGLDRSALYEGRPFRQMFMTTLIQTLIDAGWSISAALVRGGWLEFDTVEDFRRYADLKSLSKLRTLINLQMPVTSPLGLIGSGRSEATLDGVIQVVDVAKKIAEPLQPLQHEARILGMLSRKIEIMGDMSVSYRLEGKGLTPQGRAAAPDEIASVLAAFVLAYDRTGDLRYLNTSLKGLDLLRSRRSENLHQKVRALCHERAEILRNG